MGKAFVGIDPGVSGAIAWCTTTGVHGVMSMPDTVGGISDALSLIRIRNITRVFDASIYYFVESVHSSPQMGVSSAFTFGRNFGQIEAILDSCTAKYYVSPQKWQAALNCRTQGDKKISAARARELFPTLSFTQKQADALLIAYYGYIMYGKS